MTSFGLMTAPSQVDLPRTSVVQVWQDADAPLAVFDHAWLYDHLMPLGGDPLGPAFEGWTLLAALRRTDPAAPRSASWSPATASGHPRCSRRSPPAVDIVSGRPYWVLGLGSRPYHPIARREYLAH